MRKDPDRAKFEVDMQHEVHRKPINPLIDAIKGLNGLFDVMGFGR
jgi:hypothetical protein